ncbi:CRTAC1 family protein [Paraliomyxa miuraensis]|uniref:CRTAC1 family protein n=1 Tax=Paraliomyxa miuraensis TaxID=376150 RepID=UPI00225B2C38|nr:CRTAC1 family protein [Paraliomyxa miuraensis]MCX4241562.1 CRTAC1 family protein [Paraliomyxa miuraensis]
MVRDVAGWSLATVLLGGGALACGDGVPALGGGSGDQDTDALLPPPEIVAAPDAVARGSRLYVMVDLPMHMVLLDIDGQLLDGPREPLQADLPGAIVPLPDDLEVGSATLFVRRRAQPESVAEHALTVVEPRFVDVAEPIGLAHVHDVTGSPDECAESHTGLAFGDYDGDGDVDAYVGQVGRDGVLHRNVGDRDGDGLPEFEDATAAAGLHDVELSAVAMATFVDLEGDGDLDLFVGRRGTNVVLRNRLVPSGQPGFDDVTLEVGLGVESQRTMGVAFGDYDADDDLDLYVVNHAYCFPALGSEIRARDHLYRNDGGVFVERTEALGGGTAQVIDSVGFSAVWIDVERDGDQDLVVINDDVGGMISEPNALWRNDGPGQGWTFTNVAEESGVGLARVNGMGLALGDVDGDGMVDLAFTNIGENVLLLNAGDGTFVDVSLDAGIERRRLPWDRPSITWAPHLWDHDDDGDLDLYFSGGRIKGSQPVPDAFFDNRGDGTYEDLTWASGLNDPAHGKGSALVDLDGDGAWELATAVWGGTLRVYHNRMDRSVTGHHWLDVELRGRGGNRAAVGAIVELTTEAGTQTCFHTGRPSLGGGGDTACHFGLGSHAEAIALRIVWPDGTATEPAPPAVDRRVRYDQP